MKISIIACVGNGKHGPGERQMPYDEALVSYDDLADETLIADCSSTWPYEWSWDELPKHLNKVLAKATGDWVIRCDVDYVFHEKDMKKIRETLEVLSDFDVATFQKYGFTRWDKYTQKGGIPMAINKGKVGDAIKFGKPTNGKTDLCYPINVTRDSDVPEGTYTPEHFGKVGLPVYNYDCTFRTQDFQREEFWRFSKAYHSYFHAWPFGDTEDKAFETFKDMMKGRFERSPYKLEIKDHPKYIQEKLSNLTPEQFGHSGWGLFD